MKKSLMTLLAALITGLLFVAAGVLTAADVPDDVTISNTGYKSDKKGPVKLTHKKHSTEYKIACTECHHDYKDGKNVWKEGDPVKKCGACHDPVKKQGKVDKLKNAYHKNCKNCHKKLVEAGKAKAAPFKKCGDCHQKK
jgi:hypothetical protein